MSILDISKTLMYDFHYNHIRKLYGNRANLLFTDTVSLMYRLSTPDAYEDALKFASKFDTSGYSKDSPFYNATNKKVIGKMKDEVDGVPIREFIGLRSKMYSYEKENGKGGRTAKGVTKSVIKKYITRDDYKRTLEEGLQMKHNMNTIRSDCHEVGTYSLEKITLSAFDDKRFLAANGIRSLAYGHVKLTSGKDNHEIDFVGSER